MAELTERLVRRGFSEAEARSEVRRLVRLDLLDDAKLARTMVDSLLGQGYGKRAIYARLLRRKLSRGVIEEALDSVADAAAANALRRALVRARRKYPEWRTLPQARRKMIRYLLTRGFAASAVRDAVTAGDGDDAHALETFEPGDP